MGWPHCSKNHGTLFLQYIGDVLKWAWIFGNFFWSWHVAWQGALAGHLFRHPCEKWHSQPHPWDWILLLVSPVILASTKAMLTCNHPLAPMYIHSNVIKHYNWVPIVQACHTIKEINSQHDWQVICMRHPADPLICPADPGNVPEMSSRPCCWQVPPLGTFWMCLAAAFPTWGSLLQRGCGLSRVATNVVDVVNIIFFHHMTPPAPLITFHTVKCLWEDVHLWGSLPKVTEWFHLSNYTYIFFTLHDWFFPVYLNSVYTNIEELQSKKKLTYRRYKTRLIPLTPASNRWELSRGCWI